jgi:hypothetical protein
MLPRFCFVYIRSDEGQAPNLLSLFLARSGTAPVTLLLSGAMRPVDDHFFGQPAQRGPVRLLGQLSWLSLKETC